MRCWFSCTAATSAGGNAQNCPCFQADVVSWLLLQLCRIRLIACIKDGAARVPLSLWLFLKRVQGCGGQRASDDATFVVTCVRPVPCVCPFHAAGVT